MKNNTTDYGIYIDRKHAFIVSLDKTLHETVVNEETVEGEADMARTTHISQQEHTQNARHEQLHRMCKMIIAKLHQPNSIFIFGPSEAKYELQNEILNSRRLKDVNQELAVSDIMTKDAAVRFVKDHFTVISAGIQTFTAPRK